MKNKLSFYFMLIAMLFMQFSCSQTSKQKATKNSSLSAEKLELATNKMQAYVDSSKLAGISTLIFKDGEIIHRENLGFADIENQIPLKDNTIYRIFSMTKPITAVALMTLFDEGKFELDDKVWKYIPEFEGTVVYNMETKMPEPQKNEMTIRHLLTHTSGITYGWSPTDYVDSLYRVSGAGGWDGTIGEKVKILAALPLKYQPGTKWEYGLSIDVAGYLVEVLSGQPFDSYLKTKIFDPLKMIDSGFYVPEEKHSRFSSVFSHRDGKLSAGGRMSEAFKTPVTLFSGGGGLVSTMDDYLTFCKMLLNGGELNGIRIIKESTADLIMTNQLPEGVKYGKNKGYGLAGDVDLETGVYGWAGAASTKFWIDRNNKMIVFAFAQLMPANYTYADEFNKIIRSAIEKE